MFKLLLNGLCDLVYPPNCFLCKKNLTTKTPTEKLCPGCLESIRFNIPPFCQKCSRHLGKDTDKPKCRGCLKTDPQFDFAWGACFYTEPLRRLIHQYKYNQKTSLRHPLANLMASFIAQYHLDINQFDALVPIPLYPTQLRERGYNQAQLLTQNLSDIFEIPVMHSNLIKIRHTKHQTMLNEKERWTNIHGALRIKNSKDIRGKSILIIDDLLTTGATVSQAAHILKKSGAKTVGVFTLAITISNSP